MKVLFVCEGLNASSIVAQPWKHVIEVARLIRQSGVNVEIISNKSDEAEADGEILGVPTLQVEKNGLFMDVRSLAETINQADADLVNWHCSDIWSSVYFWRLRKQLKTDVVWTLHSGILSFDDLKSLNALDFLQLYKFWNNLLNAAVPKFLVRKWVSAHFLRQAITLSKRTALKLEKYGLQRKGVTPIPSGVDTSVFKPSRRPVAESSILYFGPLSSFRGVDVLISAFRRVRKTLPAARLVLLARGSEHKGFWHRKTENLENVDVVNGIFDQKELVEHLNCASVVALPFKFWPQVECPLTILESMAAGKAVVTTTMGAIPEIISNWENGVLVHPKDPKELSDVLVELLSDPHRRGEVGRKARDYVERFHDWKKIAKDTLDVLSESIN